MPVFAVGRPAEPLPQRGARRFYVDDKDWREPLLYALGRCVVIVVGPGDGLRWEIDQALRRTPPKGALFVFPLMHPPRQTLRMRLGLGRRQSALQEQHERYAAFASQLRAVRITGFPVRLDGRQAVLLGRDRRPVLLGEARPRGAVAKPIILMTMAGL